MALARHLSLRFLCLVFICLVIASCASINLSDYSFPDDPPPFLIDKSIAVLPFQGSVPPLAPAGEWFTYNLAKAGNLNILSPSQVELFFHDRNKSASLTWESSLEAAAIGRELDSQLVFLGKLSSEKNTMSWNAVCEVTLVDSFSGEILGHYKGVDMIMDYLDPVKYYMRAVNKAAYEIIGAKKKPSS